MSRACVFASAADRRADFDNEVLDRLADNAIGKQRVMAGDGSQSGWIAGDHILDTTFDLAKNVVNDALHVNMRVDEIKMPNDLLRPLIIRSN